VDGQVHPREGVEELVGLRVGFGRRVVEFGGDGWVVACLDGEVGHSDAGFVVVLGIIRAAGSGV
jgi:hypothetical protein